MSERSERDTYRGNTIENRGCLFIYLFVYMFGRTYVILYFDPRIFMLVMWSTPSQIALNRILWFIGQYPYHLEIELFTLLNSFAGAVKT